MTSLNGGKPALVWVITDGKAGDVAQCEGVAMELGCPYELKRVSPRPPFSWWLPYGPADPRDLSPETPDGLAPPFPDLAIASGRRAAGYLKTLKHRSNNRVFTVCLKDPRIGTGAADVIWVPAHDGLRGQNVMVSPTAPHRFSADRLERLRADADTATDALAAPRIAVLVGGDSRHHRFTEGDIGQFTEALAHLSASQGAGLMITVSRRTPPVLTKALKDLAQSGGHSFWEGDGANPLPVFLAKADAIVATADSTNMIGEAAATGRPIHVFHPGGGHPKITRYLGSLEKLGCLHPFPGPLKTATYDPINSTPQIAARILAEYAAFHAGSQTQPADRDQSH